MRLQLYIEGQRIELFKDEGVTINSSAQNINDISKTFSDYTQRFTVPASPQNNKVFLHWDKPEIDGFDARVRKDGEIRLGYIPFRTGTVQLNGAQKKDGKPYAYSLTFFGDLVALGDLVGEDKLTDLDLSAYQHDFDSDNVKLGLEGETLLSGDVIYPLISPVRAWQFGNGQDEDIRDSTTTLGLQWFELKPALKLTAIIDAIGVKYGVTFSNDFFGLDHFKKLFMWSSRDKDYMKAYGSPQLLSFSGQSSFFADPAWNDFRHIIDVVPEAGFEEVEYNVILDIDGVQTVFERQGTAAIQFGPSLITGVTIQWFIQSYEPFSFQSDLEILYNGVVNQDFFGSTGIVSVTGVVYFSDTVVDGIVQAGQLPELKVGDFLSGIIKMFNLIIIPTSRTHYKITTLDKWYDQGATKEFNKYIDISTEDLERPDLNSVLDFKYQESEAILQTRFKAQNGVFYGDLEYTTTYDGDELEIQLPFENMLFERMSEFSDGSLTNVRIGSAFDSEIEPVKVKPLLFYLAGQVTPTEDIGFVNDTGTKVAVSSYNNVGQEDALVDADIENSLNWGAEISSYTLTVANESLFANYWANYITDLFDKRRRLFKFSGYLPPHIISALQLNDVLVINRRRYIINSYKAELTSGKVDFELLNDLRQPTPIEDTSNGLEYELESGIE